MGCAQSKIENEEAVTRCKDRREFMKRSVTSRNAFAAAHSAYTVALKNTGAALSDYGQGEVQPDSSSSLHHQTHPSSSHMMPPPPMMPQPTYESLPPPPPLPSFSPALKRATTMPALNGQKPHLDHHQQQGDSIQEDKDGEEEEEDDDNAGHDLIHRRNRTIGGGRGEENAAPGQPPSPQTPPPPSTWDYFFRVEDLHGPSLSEAEEIRPFDNDESDDSRFTNVNYNRSENVGGVNGGVHTMNGGNEVGGSSNEEPHTPERVIEPEPAAKPAKKPKQAQMVHSNTAPPDSRRGAKAASSNINLLQILVDLDDHFLKASESAHEVSKMLEATRLHYHSNFADNRGHIDHSKRVMQVITWNRSFRGMPNGGDMKDDLDAEEHETHATVLDKLLAWEKKLYDEVKAGELMKVEYQRKVALLNKQKKRNVSTESLEKTKAAVSHLHTRYIVDMQSMDSTVSEINRLRDHQLYPKLVALVNGMTQSWEAMHIHHGTQLELVSDLRSLDVSQAPKETSEEHYGRTTQLWESVQEWHTQFQKLVNYQKEYIQNLNSWLKLNLIPIESNLKEKVSSPPRVHHPPIQSLLYAWHELLDKLPSELAGNAIHSFAGIVKSILLHQEDEVKLKERCEATKKEYARKTRQFEDWYRKHMPVPEEVDPDRPEDTNHKDPLKERQFEVETLKKRMEEEMEEHQKQCKQVREKSLSSLKTHLPELFRAMSDFSFACSDMFQKLHSISRQQAATENSG